MLEGNIEWRKQRLNALLDQMQAIEESFRSRSLPPRLEVSWNNMVAEVEKHRGAIWRASDRARRVDQFRSGNFHGEGVNEEMTGFDTPLNWRL